MLVSGAAATARGDTPLTAVSEGGGGSLYMSVCVCIGRLHINNMHITSKFNVGLKIVGMISEWLGSQRAARFNSDALLENNYLHKSK